MKTYTVRKTDKISEAAVDNVNTWPWNYSYEPETEFRVCHNGERFFVSLRCYESDPVAVITAKNGPVCNDSCIEFFFSPFPDATVGYFNFEVNSNPTYLFQYNPLGGECVNIDWDDDDLHVVSAKARDEKGDFWQINFEIPFALVKKYTPDCDLSSGASIRGNVYKCGCTDQEDHYGSWNPVDTPTPNFHIPRCFGVFALD